jgi:thiol reductant ABC exporter CydC subunit
VSRAIAAPLRGALLATRSRWPLAGASILLGAAAVCAAGALLAVSGWLISRAAQRPEILTLGVAIVGVRFFGISRALLRYAERLVSHDLAFRSLTDLRLRFFRRLVPLVPAGLPGVGAADLLSRFVADADRMQDLYLRAVGPPAVAVVAGAAFVLASYLVLPVVALAMLAILLLGGVFAPLLVRAAARRCGARQAAGRAATAAQVTAISAGAAEIALAGREEEWERRANEAGSSLGRLMRRDALSTGIAAGASEAIAAGAAVLMLTVATPAVADGRLSGVTLAALVMLALASLEIVAPLATAAASVDAVEASAARLEKVTSSPDPSPDPIDPLPVPVHGSLRLRDVSFAHPGGRAILTGADLAVAPGEAVALVGPSGIGKSTVADLLVRFLDPVTGAVELGPVDVRRLRGDELREVVRLVPQDSHLFTTTIRANLAIAAPDADDAEIRAAAEAAGLDRWLATLPDGLDTHVGEDGALVSGGQRQRIAVARGLLCNARFLVFDEPTTHLDGIAADRLTAAIAACAHERGKGVLAITHDRSRLIGFDRVVELRDCAIREIEN